MSPKHTLSKKLLLHGGIYAAARFAERATGIILVPIYARALRDQGYGAVALLGSMTPFLNALFGQGLPGAWFRLRQDYEGREERRTFEATIVWYLLGSEVVLVGLFVLFGDGLATLVAEQLPFFPLVFLAVLTAALQVFSDLYVRRANAEQRPLVVVAFSLPRTVCMLGAVIVGVAVLGRGVLGKLAAEAAVALVFALVSLTLLRPASPRHVSWPTLRRSLGFGLPVVPHTLAIQVNSMASRILISRLLGLSATGVYAMGAAVADVGNTIAMSFDQGFSPIFIKELKRLETGPDPRVRAETERALARLGLLMVAAIACVGLALTAVARDALAILATQEFRDSYRVVAPLAAATVLRSSYFAFAQALFANSTAIRRMPVVSFSGTAVNIAANVLLLPRVGFLGAAYALIIANGGMALLALFLGRAVLPLPYSLRRWMLLYVATFSGLAALVLIDNAGLALVPCILAKGAVWLTAMWLTLVAVGTSPRGLVNAIRSRSLKS